MKVPNFQTVYLPMCLRHPGLTARSHLISYGWSFLSDRFKFVQFSSLSFHALIWSLALDRSIHWRMGMPTHICREFQSTAPFLTQYIQAEFHKFHHLQLICSRHRLVWILNFIFSKLKILGLRKWMVHVWSFLQKAFCKWWWLIR